MRTFTREAGIHRRGDPSCEALDGRRGQDISVVTASGPKTPKEGTRPTRLCGCTVCLKPCRRVSLLSKFCLCRHMAFSESQSFCVFSSDTRTLVTGFRTHLDNSGSSCHLQRPFLQTGPICRFWGLARTSRGPFQSTQSLGGGPLMISLNRPRA